MSQLGGVNIIDNISCVLSDYVDVSISGRNIKYYRSVGYNCNVGDVIRVKVNDINPTSHIKINSRCPICNKEHKIQYSDYYKSKHTLCNSCASTYFNSKHNKCIYCGDKATRIFNNEHYCYKHYLQMIHYGKCMPYSSRDLNEIHYENDYAVLHVRNDEQIDIALVKIDTKAVDIVKDIHWTYSKADGFIVSTGNIKLHRFLYQKLVGEITKHYILFKNNDIFDMRSENLVQSNDKTLALFSDEDSDIDGIFFKDNLKVGIIDDTHYKLLNIRELKDMNSNKKPIIVEVDKNGCWNCISHSKHPDGYVYVFSGNKKIKLHKKVLELKIGRELQVNNDELTRHTCDNPQCCNPDHLLIGNSQQNHDDMVSRGRGYWQTHTGYYKWYERNKKHKKILSKDTVVNIYKEALENHIPYSVLDKKYNVCRGVSANIANKKTYTDITNGIEINDTRDILIEQKKEIYVLVKNLKDGNLYTNKEIANLIDSNKETVRNIVNDEWTYSSKDIQDYNSKFVGDGSGVIYYMDIKYDTIVDGVDFRNTVYCAKCNIHCEECHNPQSWNIRNGKPISINNLAQLLLENGNDITFSGGECSLQSKGFTKLAQILKKNKRNIWLYSGNIYEDLIQNPQTKALLDTVDVLVDGKFVKELQSVDLLFKGSSNQRIIDLNKTRECGDIVLWTR